MSDNETAEKLICGCDPEKTPPWTVGNPNFFGNGVGLVISQCMKCKGKIVSVHMTRIKREHPAIVIPGRQ